MNDYDVQMKRKISRKFIVKVIILLFSLGVIALFLNSPLLAVSKVSVEGNKTLTKEQVCQIAQLKEPVNLFALRTDYLQTRLESDLRIKKAVVRRNFPNELSIEIKERTPIATVRCIYGYVDVAGDGTVLSAHKNIKTMKYPLLTGLILGDSSVGDRVTDDGVVRAADFLSDLDDPSLEQISEINLASEQNIIAYTTSGVKIKLGDLSMIEQEAKKTTVFLKDLKSIKRSVDYVDLGYASPVLKFKS